MGNSDSVVLEDRAQTGQANQPPGGAVGLVQKELPPISSKVVSEVSEIIKESEKEPNIDEDVKKAGVEAVFERPNLTEEHAEIGMEHSGESVPVATKTLGTDQFPMTEAEAENTLKTSKKDDSIFGLAKVIIREIHKRISNTK